MTFRPLTHFPGHSILNFSLNEMCSLVCPNRGPPPHHLSQAGFSHQEIYEQQVSFAQLPPEYIHYKSSSNGQGAMYGQN